MTVMRTGVFLLINAPISLALHLRCGALHRTHAISRCAVQLFEPRVPHIERTPSVVGLEKVYISIAGLIGAGKSTLATALGERLDLPVYYEPVAGNEYLDDFYKDMERYGFALQVHLLQKRFRQQQEIVWTEKGAVQDRTIYEDAVFARVLHEDGLMSERDYRTYLALFETMSHFMQRPDVIVYLDVSPEESLRRIRMRKRECESGVDLAYLTKLHAAYESFIQGVSHSVHVIRVDWNEFRSTEEMAQEISRQYAMGSHISEAHFS